MSASWVPRKKRQIDIGGLPAASTRLSQIRWEALNWPLEKHQQVSGWDGSGGKSWTDTQRITGTTPPWLLVSVAMSSTLTTLLDSGSAGLQLLSVVSCCALLPVSMALPQVLSPSLPPGSANPVSWFLIQLSAGLLGFWFMCLVSLLLFLLTWTTAPGLWAQAQATAVYSFLLTLGLWSLLPVLLPPSDLPLGWRQLRPSWSCPFHTQRHLASCSLKPQAVSVLRAWVLTLGVSPSPPCEERPSWESLVAQAIQTTDRHKIYSVRTLHLSLNISQQPCNSGISHVGDLAPPSPSKLESLGL